MPRVFENRRASVMNVLRAEFTPIPNDNLKTPLLEQQKRFNSIDDSVRHETEVDALDFVTPNLQASPSIRSFKPASSPDSSMRDSVEVKDIEVIPEAEEKSHITTKKEKLDTNFSTNKITYQIE